MRTFVAVFPPPEVQEVLLEAARRPAQGHGFRLTTPERVHLTLNFLGDVPPEDLGGIAEALAPLEALHEPFAVVPHGFGVFPSARRARIFWAGIGEGAQRLGALARDTDALLEKVGFEGDNRPYVPHLTLGRARRPVRFDPGDDVRAPELRFAVQEVRLVESRPEGGGVVYATLATFAL